MRHRSVIWHIRVSPALGSSLGRYLHCAGLELSCGNSNCHEVRLGAWSPASKFPPLHVHRVRFLAVITCPSSGLHWCFHPLPSPALGRAGGDPQGRVWAGSAREQEVD